LNVFLDSSVLLAACGSATGASAEVEANLGALPAGGPESWPRIRDALQKVPDVLTFEWPAVFAPARDRPILFTACAWAEVLLTLDRRDFAGLLGSSLYGLAILRPGEFLRRERETGRFVSRASP
jgi:hypothetical protein